MKDLSQKLLAIFQLEYKEHLTRIRAILGAVESGEGTLAGPELDEVFRRAHSLKGAARAVSMPAVERLSHSLEAVFAKLRDGKLLFDRSAIPALHLVLDSLEDTVNASAEGKVPPEPSQAHEALTALLEGQTPRVNIALTEQTAPQAESDLPVSPATPKEAGTLRVATENIDRILELADQLMTESVRQDAIARDLSHLAQEFARVGREQGLMRQQYGSQLRRLAEAHAYSGIAGYINYMEHQILSLHSECRPLAASQSRGAWSLHQATGELHEAVERARMVPAESLYEGFGKMVRDLARSRGKQVTYEAEGLETLADRAVLESLKDPVMHMLRNAVDHAIEEPEVRRSLSKPAAGLIRLTLKAASGRLLLTVEDDGCGLNLARIAALAGGPSASPAASPSAPNLEPDELRRLIFQPGFTTSSRVTDLSGRGMGLSVVEESVRRLQGHVEVRVNPAAGVTFAISTPLAVFSQHLVLLQCGGQAFGIPAPMVEHLYRVKVRSGFESVEGTRVFQARGRAVPVFLLTQLLSLNVPPDLRDDVPVAVVNVNGRRAALVVDAFLSNRQAVVQDVCRTDVFGNKAAGAILLEDGSVAIVLELPGLLENSNASHAPGQRTAPADNAPPEMPAILVVDDSMTTRTLEKGILESQGYQVSVAVNGVEALEMLRRNRIDLIITDVEMPLMDGFSLIQEVKKEPKLSGIPIIIVSSLEKREDKERGLSLGAEAYIVKRSFEQQELLEAIRQII